MRRLIVSFIGNADLKYLPPQAENVSPILRLLMGLPGGLQPSRTRLLLLDEQSRGTERQMFCSRLEAVLPELGLGGLEVKRHPIVLPDGPTDLNALYEQVWAAIPTSGPDQADEILFHISSGTWAMQSTLLLAANCLRLERVRLIETSREQGVREVRPPYVLAARDRRLSERMRGKVQLPEKARRALLPDTVISDPVVHAAYAALHKAATNRKLPQRLLLRGPVGSGKWHACQQFARWRRAATATWLEPDALPELPVGATLLIHRLDAWPKKSLQGLALLSAQRPDVAIGASFRTDLPPAVPLDVLMRDGLRGAAQVDLPSLGSRSDVVEIAEALVRNLGALGGKVKARFQYELLTDVYPHNLHDLKALLATAVVRSPGGHPERNAYVQAKQIQHSQVLLTEAWQILAGMDFGPGRHRLENVLDVIRAAIVRRALVDGRSQEDAGELLGFSRSKVSAIETTPLDLSGWRTSVEQVDGSA
jgi:hypothetical protein